MSVKLRRLNSDGVDRFRDYLNDLQSTPTLAAPRTLLNDPSFSRPVDGAGALESVALRTKSDAAIYLHRLLKNLEPQEVDRDVGLWAWLTLNYFDDVCPAAAGMRKPHKVARYILEPLNHQRRYRHVLWTPYWILRMMPDHNRIYLNEALTVTLVARVHQSHNQEGVALG